MRVSSFWADEAVRATALAQSVHPDPCIRNRISRARIAAACPLELAATLRGLADAAQATGLNSGTRATYNSHVGYFLEFGLCLGCDIYRFGAPVEQGGLPPEEESKVSENISKVTRLVTRCTGAVGDLCYQLSPTR